MSVATALSLWPQIQSVAKAHHMLIGAPSAVNFAAGGWLDQFLQGARAKGYEVDFICLHPYVGDATVAAATTDLQNKLVAAHNQFGLPIWVTEYAMADWSRSGDPYFGQATEASFATSSVNMMNGLSYVQRYAWLAAIPSIGGYTDTATCTTSGSNTQVEWPTRSRWKQRRDDRQCVHTLTPACATGSRLDDNAAGTANGNKVQIWAANGSQAQNWSFANVGGTSYNVAVNLGSYCLDGGAATQGDPVADLELQRLGRPEMEWDWGIGRLPVHECTKRPLYRCQQGRATPMGRRSRAGPVTVQLLKRGLSTNRICTRTETQYEPILCWEDRLFEFVSAASPRKRSRCRSRRLASRRRSMSGPRSRSCS